MQKRPRKIAPRNQSVNRKEKSILSLAPNKPPASLLIDKLMEAHHPREFLVTATGINPLCPQILANSETATSKRDYKLAQ